MRQHTMIEITAKVIYKKIKVESLQDPLKKKVVSKYCQLAMTSVFVLENPNISFFPQSPTNGPR